MAEVLGSEWIGLNPLLIANFYLVKSSTPTDLTSFYPIEGPPTVAAPITDTSFEFVSSWNSMFEDMTADKGLGTLSALLTSGTGSQLLNALAETGLAKKAQADGLLSRAADSTQQLQGRSSMTRMNSIQIFNGSPPVKVMLTAHFRAWSNPAVEVEGPIRRLIEWQAPVALAENAVSAATDGGGGIDALRYMYPSVGPRPMGFSYAGRSFYPFVIESLTYTLTDPRDKSGDLVRASVQMTLGSLTSLDGNDIRRMFGKS